MLGLEYLHLPILERRVVLMILAVLQEVAVRLHLKALAGPFCRKPSDYPLSAAYSISNEACLFGLQGYIQLVQM